MRILVVGAYGLIGGYVATRLQQDGHDVVGVGRNVASAARRWPSRSWIEVDVGKATAAWWEPRLSGVDAVVNCSGALQDGPGDDLNAVHVRAVEALGNACVSAGVHRFVQISAVGVEDGPGAFSATKRLGDEALRALDLDWVILRPGLVLAPAAYGGSALLRGLAGFPGVIPLVHGRSVVQVTGIGDLREYVARAVLADGPSQVTVDLTANEATDLLDVLTALRGWLGLPPAWPLHLPAWIAIMLGRLADVAAWLGWRSPLRSAALAQLRVGVRGAPDDAFHRFGIAPRTLSAVLAIQPSSAQDRWHSRLYFAKPTAIVTLAIFWILSGAVGLANHKAAASLLTGVGFSSTAATALDVAGAAIDLALGILVCFRRSAASALKAMVVVTAGYLVAATLLRPDLWADPLGPLVKTIPAAVLAIVALAMMDDR